MTPTAPNDSLDARVELIVELIVELSDDRRAQLARRLADVGGVWN